MDIIKLALGLVERHGRLLGANPGTIDGIAERFKEEINSSTAWIAALMEKRAGLTTTTSGICDENRLGDPRLRTTYPDERRRALTSRMLRYDDELAIILLMMALAAAKAPWWWSDH